MADDSVGGGGGGLGGWGAGGGGGTTVAPPPEPELAQAAIAIDAKMAHVICRNAGICAPLVPSCFAEDAGNAGQ